MPIHGHIRSSSNTVQQDHSASQGNALGGDFQGLNPYACIKNHVSDCTLMIAIALENPFSPNSLMMEQTSTGFGFHGSSPASAPASAIPNTSQGFETPRRMQGYSRNPEELHIPLSNSNISRQTSKDSPRQHSYNSSYEYPGPSINVQQATPQAHNNFSAPPINTSLPGALQSGRPGPSSATTAPSTVPTLPQTPSHPQHTIGSSRASSNSQAHGYSRSSPAGLEQKYVPFINTPENSKYASTPTNKYNSSQPPKEESSYSPLGLADIRPHHESGLPDTPSSTMLFANDDLPTVPTNSNYLAPWPVYAFDWCKWPVQQQQHLGDKAGKMAIGSYVEDGHNFV